MNMFDLLTGLVIFGLLIVAVVVAAYVLLRTRAGGRILTEKDLEKLQKIDAGAGWVYEDLVIPYPECTRADPSVLSRAVETLRGGSLCILASDRRLSVVLVSGKSERSEIFRVLKVVYPSVSLADAPAQIPMNAGDYVAACFASPKKAASFLPLSAFSVGDDALSPILSVLEGADGVSAVIHVVVERKNWERQIGARLRLLERNIQMATARGEDASRLRKVRSEIEERRLNITFALAINAAVWSEDRNKAESVMRAIENCLPGLGGPGRFTISRADPIKVLGCVVSNKPLARIPVTSTDLTCIVHLPVRPVAFRLKRSSRPMLGRLPSVDDQSILVGWQD
jgi:hypothetical protein